MAQGFVFPAPAIGATRLHGAAGSSRQVAEQLATADCADLSRHWPLCPVAAVDCTWFDALLHLLPGLVHCVLIQVHGQAERFRLDDLLEQHCRVGIAAGTIPAFCSDVSGEAANDSAASLAVGIGIRAGRAAARDVTSSPCGWLRQVDSSAGIWIGRRWRMGRCYS